MHTGSGYPVLRSGDERNSIGLMYLTRQLFFFLIWLKLIFHLEFEFNIFLYWGLNPHWPLPFQYTTAYVHDEKKGNFQKTKDSDFQMCW